VLLRELRGYKQFKTLDGFSSPFSEHFRHGGLRKGHGGVMRITEVEYMRSAAALRRLMEKDPPRDDLRAGLKQD